MSRGGGGREAERKLLRLLHGHPTGPQLPQIHAAFIRRNLHQSNILLTHFVSACAALRKLCYARQIFNQTQNPNLLLFNSIIKGYSISGPSEEALNLFSLMKCRGIWPDGFTFPPLLKSCSNIYNLDIGRAIHAQVLTVGFESHNSVQIGLVELYASCGRMRAAQRVFNEMLYRDAVVWNLMIHGFCRIGDVDSGFHFFLQMIERSVVSWNSIISGLAQCGRDSEALKLFGEMWDAGFEPDDATVVIMLPVCSRLGDLDLGKWIHSYTDRKKFIKKVINVGNSLVDMYCKCGDLASARRVFDEMPQRNVVSWNAMILGLAYNGCGELGIDIFEEMKRDHVEPNDATFVGILGYCRHLGLVQRGRELFDSMKLEYQIEPNLQHYGCMVDLLGRSGCLKEAVELIGSMPMRPSAAIWGALLNACRSHHDLEVAEIAAKKLVDLEPWNSGNYVLLSNVYAEVGRWADAEKVRALMREQSVCKTAGVSMIESKLGVC